MKFNIDNPPTATDVSSARTNTITKYLLLGVGSVSVLIGTMLSLPFVFKAVIAFHQSLFDIEMGSFDYVVGSLGCLLYLSIIGLLFVSAIGRAQDIEELSVYKPVSPPEMEEILTLASDHPEIERYRAAVAQMKREFFVSDLVTMRDFVTAKAAQVEAEKKQMEIDALKSQLYRASN